MAFYHAKSATPMTPQTLLQHNDSGALWSAAVAENVDLPAAYQSALALRQLRCNRGEQPRGYKIGFTNRNIWPRYGVYAPIWGTVYDSTLSFCDDEGSGSVSLQRTCQPRIEPELVFGMKATPAANASLDQLFAAIEWLAPGFEIVQSHLPDWKFKAADTVTDGALHARLLVGRKVLLANIAASVSALNEILAAATVNLLKDGQVIDRGCGANVLSSPLHALQHFLTELRLCPGAPDLMAGDIVTTGTWTDAWPVQPGEQWSGDFGAPLSRLSVHFC